ncbi:hypothetical protein FZEAL_3376 [Fusarium zealandicum]|uniref:Uncharacterized protein n=1 Tax=Fusarium zealandicum TaxID=1053134 RepID=A0A8H4UPU1_9HYPO|nr:hypothetical protein FZEAL_3376 [Fusarium zealandicum]
MLQLKTIIPRLRPSQLTSISRQAAPSQHLAITRTLRRTLQKSLQQCQQRCYAKPVSPVQKASQIEDELKRQARAASKNNKGFELPERLIIYHAGTGRTTFLAMVKITTLFLGAFFCCIVVPSYIKAEMPWWEIARVALSGLVPIFFVAFISSSFVTHIYLHLPPYARTSGTILTRFIRTLPPSTRLTMTTMSAIAKPRYSSLQAGDLFPVHRRLGLVNYVRDTADENARRRWYMFRAVGKFYVQDTTPPRMGRYELKKGKVDRWVWDDVKKRIGTKAQKTPSA